MTWIKYLSKLSQRVSVASVAAVLAGMVIVVIVGVVLYVRHDIPGRLGPDPGPTAAERYALEYVDALNTNEPGPLSGLVGRPADSLDIRERLRLYGGRDLSDVEVTVVQEFLYHYRVWIVARAGDGSVVEMYQIVTWNGERWDMSPLYTGPPPPR